MPRLTLKVLSACPKTLGFIPRACSRSMTTSTTAKVKRMISNHTNCHRGRALEKSYRASRDRNAAINWNQGYHNALKHPRLPINASYRERTLTLAAGTAVWTVWHVNHSATL